MRQGVRDGANLFVGAVYVSARVRVAAPVLLALAGAPPCANVA